MNRSNLSITRDSIAKSWIYLCYLIYPIVILIFFLPLITSDAALTNILPRILRVDPLSLWRSTVSFTFLAFDTFSIITLLGMIGWLTTIQDLLAKQMKMIVVVFGGCALLIIFGFFLLLAGIGVFMILYALLFPLIYPVVNLLVNKPKIKDKTLNPFNQ